ncbi:MAG: 3-phenylpropionate/cinnamic acid dioxygenase subunit beta [Alphaproteobacteria bacterium]
MNAPTSKINEDKIRLLLLRSEVEQFFLLEAELLDARRFTEWLDLLHEDLHYWMPIARNFPAGHYDEEYTSPGRDLNWFDEGKFALEQRVEQLLGGDHWAEEPLSRTSHFVTNIRVKDETDERIESESRFLVYRNRTETETDIFAGKRKDVLLRGKDGELLLKDRSIFLDQSVLTAKSLTIFF